MSIIKYLRYGILSISLVAILWFGGYPIRAEGESPQPTYTEEMTFESGFIQLNCKNIHVDSFVEVLFNAEGTVYVPLSKVFPSLELKFQTDLVSGYVAGSIPQTGGYYHFDFLNGVYRQGTQQFTISRTEYRVQGGEIYVTTKLLSNWLPIEVDWDDFLMEVAIYPKFQLVSEIFQEREETRQKLLAQQTHVDDGEIIQMMPTAFKPGLFRYYLGLAGGLTGFTGPSVQLGYVGPVLYGDFVGQIGFSPESGFELKTIQQKYRDLWGLKEIVLGSNLIEIPSILGRSTVMQGLSIRNIDDQYKYGVTVLSGMVPQGSDVELYYQGMLLGFQRAQDGMYSFGDIPTRGAYNVFEVVVYTPEGRIYREKQYVLARDQQLAKGKYYYGGGVGIAKDGPIGNGKFYYGINDQLTVGGAVTLLPPQKNIIALEEPLEEEGSSLENKPKDSVKAFVGGEAVLKLNPGTVLYTDAHYGVTGEGLAYRAGVKSAPGSVALRAGVMGYAGDGFTDRESLLVESSLYRLSQEVEFEAEYSHARQNIALGYHLKNYDRKLRHEVQLRYQTQASRFLYMRLQNELGLGANAPLTNMFTTSISYSGLGQIDLYADGQLTLSERGLDYYGAHVEVVNKRHVRSPFSYSAGLQLNAGKLDLTGNLQYQLRDWLNIKASVGLRMINVSINLSETRRLAWPAIKVKSDYFGMGWVEGRVYLDENGNGIFDDGENTFSGVSILVNDQPQGISNHEGFYEIQGVKPYQKVKVGLDSTTLDALYLPTTDSVTAVVNPGVALQVDFGVVPCSGLSGQIVGFEQGDREQVEKITVVLLDEAGAEVYRTVPEYDGFFIIEQIQPGNYLLTVQLGDSGIQKQLSPLNYRIEIPHGEMPKWYDDLRFELIIP